MAKISTGTMDGTKNISLPAAGIDLIHHEVRVNLFQVKDKKEFLLETLTFKGRMVIERGNPYKNEKGVQEIDFFLRGHSKNNPPILINEY